MRNNINLFKNNYYLSIVVFVFLVFLFPSCNSNQKDLAANKNEDSLKIDLTKKEKDEILNISQIQLNNLDLRKKIFKIKNCV